MKPLEKELDDYIRETIALNLSDLEESLESPYCAIQACATLGFYTRHPAIKEFIFWWKNASDDVLEDAIVTWMYSTYENAPDGAIWAREHYMLIGLEAFAARHSLKLSAVVKEAYQDLLSSISFGIGRVNMTKEYQISMRLWEKITRKLNRCKLHRSYRRRRRSYKR